MSSEQSLLEPNARVLSTLEKDGSRRWLYPRLSRGAWWSRRRIVAYLLIAVFTLLPYLKLKGKPVILLDIVRRRFTFFGYAFLPTDTALLALLAVSCILTVFFVTALLGRVWCGWGCPQTVYMEFVFRPIERLFTGRTGTGGRPRQGIAEWRTTAMYACYLLVCVYLAHTFLSYFVGVDQLRHWVAASPVDHPAAFVVMAGVTGLMMFNFAFFREQTCIIACPYGRFQSAMLDRWSLTIAYDRGRGEPRGRRVSLPLLNRSATPESVKGDCVDCGLCAAVCPTGIDIRDGLQFECVGCAQCIDACDAVTDKIARPRGLIRYSSQAAAAGQKSRLLRPRVLIYPAIIAVLGGLLVFLLATKSAADVTLLRGLGRPFVIDSSGLVENTLRVKVTNRSDAAQHLTISAVGPAEVRVVAGRPSFDVPTGASVDEPVQVLAPPGLFVLGTLDVTIRVSDGEGLEVNRPCRLLGPAVSTSVVK